MLKNISNSDKLYNTLNTIVDTILSTDESKYITEIYIKNGSIYKGLLTNWVRLMIEVDPEFVNKSLYDILNQLEDEYEDIHLAISIEPNTVERGHGTIIYQKE